MEPPHSKLLRKYVAAENALRAGCGSGMENRKETGSEHRGPDVRKRTPVEDAASRVRGQADTKPARKVESVCGKFIVVGELVGASLSTNIRVCVDATKAEFMTT